MLRARTFGGAGCRVSNRATQRLRSSPLLRRATRSTAAAPVRLSLRRLTKHSRLVVVRPFMAGIPARVLRRPRGVETTPEIGRFVS